MNIGKGVTNWEIRLKNVKLLKKKFAVGKFVLGQVGFHKTRNQGITA